VKKVGNGKSPKGKKNKSKKKGKQASRSGTKTIETQVATLEDWQRLTPSSDLGEAMDSMGAPRRSWILSTPLPEAPVKAATATIEDSTDTLTASLPLSLAGFSNDSYAQLDKLFGAYGMDPLRASGTGSPKADGPTSFEMGSSIAVQLIRGDLSAAVTGTVSYIDGDTLLAFGHSMFESGELYAPIATSEVVTVMPSAQSAFVMAQPVNEVGALVEDRQSHVKMDLGLRHPMIPVDVYVTQGKNTEEFHTEIWNNKFFAVSLAGASVGTAINLIYPDRADATARIESSVEIRGEKKPLVFVDYLYSSDGATSLIGGARALRVLVPLLLNPWTPVTIERVAVKVDLSFDTNYGDIKELRLPSTELEPGKTHYVEVVLESYGKKDIVDTVPFEVPAELAGQIVTIEVSAGDAARLDAPAVVDLKSLVRAVRKLLPGDVYAVSLYGAEQGVSVDGIAVSDLPASIADQLHPGASTQNVDDYRPVSRTTSPATRVVNGMASASVKIAEKKR
jgi:hypothetical protein